MKIKSNQYLLVTVLTLLVAACGGGNGGNGGNGPVENNPSPEKFGMDTSDLEVKYISADRMSSVETQTQCRHIDSEYVESKHFAIYRLIPRNMSEAEFRKSQLYGDTDFLRFFAASAEISYSELLDTFGMTDEEYRALYPYENGVVKWIGFADYPYLKNMYQSLQNANVSALPYLESIFNRYSNSGTKSYTETIMSMTATDQHEFVSVVKREYTAWYEANKGTVLASDYVYDGQDKIIVCIDAAALSGGREAGMRITYAGHKNLQDFEKANNYMEYRRVFKHELVHSMSEAILAFGYDVDRWLIEGGAEYFSGGKAEASVLSRGLNFYADSKFVSGCYAESRLQSKSAPYEEWASFVRQLFSKPGGDPGRLYIELLKNIRMRTAKDYGDSSKEVKLAYLSGDPHTTCEYVNMYYAVNELFAPLTVEQIKRDYTSLFQ